MDPSRSTSCDALLSEVLEQLERRGESLRRLAAEIHRDPELGCREYHSAARLAGELEEEGFQVVTGLAGMDTAFRAERGRGAPAVAFLVEYDAVPEMGHACGHNLIAAVSLGAAVALGQVVDRLGGRVVVIGAPAEETVGGKVVLAVRGALDDLDAALLAHPGSENCAQVRTVASWSMEVVFEGRASHAVAAPERGVDALACMVRLLGARDALLAELGEDFFAPGVILEGGVRPNLVPALARARFSLRAPSREALVDRLLPRFRALVESIAASAGARGRLRAIDNLYDELISSPLLSRLYRAQARQEGLEVVERSETLIGSLDTGTVSQRVPVLHPIFSIVDEPVPTHTEAFTRAAAGPRALAAAARVTRILARVGFALLAEPGLLATARREHADQLRGRPPRQDVPLITEQDEP
ncbi:MAG: amidohydrolase [Acidobacteriota bacterium]|nr:amidohydrolase [Acidobacteriota bacterium]